MHVGTLEKKLFSNVLISKELFLVKKTPTNFFLKVKKTKGMPLFSRNLKIHFPRNKLIQYKSCVLWKTQPKLFQNCAKLHTRQKTVFKPNFVKRIARKLSINVDKKPFSNQILSRESLLGAKTTRKLSLEGKNANGMPLLSKNLKIQYPRNKPIPYKFPAL